MKSIFNDYGLGIVSFILGLLLIAGLGFVLNMFAF